MIAKQGDSLMPVISLSSLTRTAFSSHPLFLHRPKRQFAAAAGGKGKVYHEPTFKEAWLSDAGVSPPHLYEPALRFITSSRPHLTFYPFLFRLPLPTGLSRHECHRICGRVFLGLWFVRNGVSPRRSTLKVQ